MRSRRSPTEGSALWAAAIVVMAILLWPRAAHAYIGPGAGVAFATTALALLVSLILVLTGLLIYPLRLLWRLARRRRPPNPPRIRRAVLIGLDGLDPDLCRRLMAQGQLPHMQRLADAGCFHRLATTNPAMSPVAWSSFATGTSPAKHGIFDFLTRDPRTYQPDLSSADVRPPRRHLPLGPYRIPLGRPQVRLLRKSRPFWDQLGRHGVPSSILRVPITFPAEPFAGTMLSAMCVPDLAGTQGTFTLYSTDAADVAASVEEGGRRVGVVVRKDRVDTWIVGPSNPLRKDGREVRVRLRLELDRAAGTATARVGRRRVTLRRGEFSDWVPIAFPLGLGLTMRGICRMRLLDLAPLRLYLSPINIDPENPVLPISHPRIFATFLSKLIGRYATLGLAEDTWALNQGVLDEDAFLEQAWANHDEREAMFFAMLRRTRRGLVTCVFDGTDRIQHMFTRHADPEHPARDDEAQARRYGSVIDDTYRRMDDLVGRVLDEVDLSDPDNLVAVLSDHGFKTFRRGINLNAWLLQEGYLVLEEGKRGTDAWFAGVDWKRTRAFALGLGGIFLNVKGREAEGIVSTEEAPALADQIAARLEALIDPAVGRPAIRKAHPSHRLYRGPYADQAPDVLVGYAAGWRVSWDGARGIAAGEVFSDNTRAWSGDHCIDPELVPGVLIANQPLGCDVPGPRIIDLAPTMLDLFGIPAPRYMDGVSLIAPRPVETSADAGQETPIPWAS
jgi:predicted AlkP superfamily phosphohydrolase/phosphomutase